MMVTEKNTLHFRLMFYYMCLIILARIKYFIVKVCMNSNTLHVQSSTLVD